MSEPRLEGYREFLCIKDDRTIVNLSVRHPGKKELESADMEYSGVFNHSLLSGLPTQAKMLRILREKEVITPAEEAEMGQLTEDIRAMSLQIRDKKYGSVEETNKVREELSSKQSRLTTLNREIEAMLAHTADSKAGESQRNFLIACVVEFADGPKKGERVWDDVDQLLANKDSAMLNRVLYEYMMCQADMPSEWDRLIAADKPAEPDKKDETVPKVVIDAANAAVPVIPTVDVIAPPAPAAPEVVEPAPVVTADAPPAPEAPAEAA